MQAWMGHKEHEQENWGLVTDKSFVTSPMKCPLIALSLFISTRCRHVFPRCRQVFSGTWPWVFINAGRYYYDDSIITVDTVFILAVVLLLILSNNKPITLQNLVISIICGNNRSQAAFYKCKFLPVPKNSFSRTINLKIPILHFLCHSSNCLS